MVGEERIAPVIPSLESKQSDDGQPADEGEEGGEFDGLEHGEAGGG